MKKTLYQIFKIFFKIGTLLLGGGYVILPLLQAELVDKRNWISDDELCEYYALGQSIPGIIAANVSIFVGYKLRGILGAISAIIGIVLPAFVAIIILARIMTEITGLGFIQNIFWGVSVGVMMLIFLSVKEIWRKSVIDNFSCFIFFLAFILSACFDISPAIIVLGAIFIGVWVQLSKNIAKRLNGGKNDRLS